MQDVLGFGLLHPFQRDGRSDLVADGGERLVRSAVAQILGTIGASELMPGELPWSELGSQLYRLRHQKNDHVLQELARVYVVDALKRWEPRVVVTAVQVTREQLDGENVLAIRIGYDVIATNTPGNNVILASVEQTVRA